MAKLLTVSVFLMSFTLASTVWGQEPDAALVAKAAQEVLLMMPDPPLGFAIAKHPVSVQGNLMGFQIQMMKEGSISKVLVNISKGEFAERPARQAAYKAYVNTFAKGLTADGFKVSASKLPDVEKSDFKTPMVADMTFVNDKGKTVYAQKRIFFTTKAYDVSILAGSDSELKVLSTWAAGIRPVTAPTSSVGAPATPAVATTTSPPTTSAAPPPATPAVPKTDAAVDIQATVTQAFRLLEAKDFVGFYNTCLPPDEVKTLTDNGTLNDAAKKFGETKSARFMLLLSIAKKVKPTIDPSGNNAVIDIQGVKSIKFVKAANRWYIQM